MRLNVTVQFGTDQQDYDIAVGDGSRTVKWLASIASQRFTARGPRGSVRRREPKLAQPQGSSYMPSLVATDEDSNFCHPDEVLEKRFYDGQHVTVTLARKIPVDDCGHTKLSRWAIIAFAKSESQAKLREAAIEEEYRIQAEQKAQREAEAEAIRLAEIQFKAGEMRNVIKVQLPNEEKIGEALMEDWYNMNRKSALDDWVRSPLEQRAVKDIFRQNYAQLSELFAMYGAASAQLAQSHEMEFSEFSQFVNDLALFEDKKNTHDLLVTIFQKSHCYLDLKSALEATNASLDRAGFFNCIIQCAVLKYSSEGSEEKVRRRRDSIKLGEQSITEQLTNLLSGFITPYIEKRLVGAMIKHALGNDEVLALFYDNHEALYKCFDKYSDASVEGDETSKLTDGMMTAAEFVMLIEDSGLIGSTGAPGETHDELTPKEVRQAFASAQTEVAFGAEEKALQGELALSHLQLMSYPEYIEAIARVGALKWERKETDVGEKIAWTVKAIVNSQGER